MTSWSRHHHMRLEFDDAIATSILPTGGFGMPAETSTFFQVGHRPAVAGLRCLLIPRIEHDDVTGSGSPWRRPDAGSMPTRHRFMLPPRSLAKYSQRPSGAHTGFQSTGASWVIATGVPPAAG